MYVIKVAFQPFVHIVPTTTCLLQGLAVQEFPVKRTHTLKRTPALTGQRPQSLVTQKTDTGKAQWD